MATSDSDFYQDPNDPRGWIRSGYTPDQIASMQQQAAQLPSVSSVVMGRKPTPEQMLASGGIDRATYEQMTGRATPDTSLMASLFPRTTAAIEDHASYPRQALGAGLDLASGLGRGLYAGAQNAFGTDSFQQSLGRVSAPNTSSTASAMVEDLVRDPSNVLIPLTFGAGSAIPAVGRGLAAVGRLGQAGLEGLSQAALSGANDYASTGKSPTLGESVARAGLGAGLGLGMKLAPSVARMAGGLFNRAPGTPEGDAFQKWFGGSQVVDEAGNPLAVYHGTVGDFYQFDPNKLGSVTGAESSKKGFFFSGSPQTGSEYSTSFGSREYNDIQSKLTAAENQAKKTQNPSDWEKFERLSEALDELSSRELKEGLSLSKNYVPSGANVMPAYLNIKSPLVIDFNGKEYEENAFNNAIDKARLLGNDGVIFKNANDNPTTSGILSDIYFVRNPAQIKSVFNRGTWDPTDPNIMRIDNPGSPASPVPYDPLAYLKTHIPGTLRSASIQAFGPGNTQGAQP